MKTPAASQNDPRFHGDGLRGKYHEFRLKLYPDRGMSAGISFSSVPRRTPVRNYSPYRWRSLNGCTFHPMGLNKS